MFGVEYVKYVLRDRDHFDDNINPICINNDNPINNLYINDLCPNDRPNDRPNRSSSSVESGLVMVYIDIYRIINGKTSLRVIFERNIRGWINPGDDILLNR